MLFRFCCTLAALINQSNNPHLAFHGSLATFVGRPNCNQTLKVLDLLNDFDRTKGESLVLPNLLEGEPLDIVVKVLLSGGAIGQSMILKLSLSWIQHGNIDPESTRKECSIIYAASNDMKIQSVNPEAQKALQLLEAARIKRKVMAYLDRGDFH